MPYEAQIPPDSSRLRLPPPDLAQSGSARHKIILSS